MSIQLAGVLILAATAASSPVENSLMDEWARTSTARANILARRKIVFKFLLYLDRGSRSFHLVEYEANKSGEDAMTFVMRQQLSVAIDPKRIYLSDADLKRRLDPRPNRRELQLVDAHYEKEAPGESNLLEFRFVSEKLMERIEVGSELGLMRRARRHDRYGKLLEDLETLEIDMTDNPGEMKEQQPRIILLKQSQRDKVESYLRYFQCPTWIRDAIVAQ